MLSPLLIKFLNREFHAHIMKMIKPMLLMSMLILVIILSGCTSDLGGKSISVPTKEEIFGGSVEPATNAEFYIHPEGTSIFIGLQPLSEDGFPVPANGTLRVMIQAEDGNMNLFDKSYTLTYDDFTAMEGRGYMQYEVKIKRDEIKKTHSYFGLLYATFTTDGNVITSDEYHFDVPHYTHEEMIAQCEVDYLMDAREQNVGKEVGDLVLIVDFPGVEQAIKASVALTKMTGVSFTSSPAVLVEDFDKMIAEI